MTAGGRRLMAAGWSQPTSAEQGGPAAGQRGRQPSGTSGVFLGFGA